MKHLSRFESDPVKVGVVTDMLNEPNRNLSAIVTKLLGVWVLEKAVDSRLNSYTDLSSYVGSGDCQIARQQNDCCSSRNPLSSDPLHPGNRTVM